VDNTGSTDLAPDTVLVSDASYAPFGPVTGVRNGLQKRLTRGLDLNYAPTAIDSETPGGLGLRYTMDEVGNISRLASAASGRSAPRLDLEYDPLQRLTGAYAANGHGQAFGYTATGDRSEIAEVGFGPILPVDVAYAPGTHRLVAVGATARSVDAAGNTTSRGDGVGLAYDARNRLTEVTLPGGNTRYTYLYNGKGERVGKKKTLAGSPVGASYFVYDEGGRLLGEYTASGAAVAEYLYFNDALYAVATPTDLYYVETDHLGTPRTLVSSARQTVVWSWDALDAKGAFGASAPDADPDHDGVPMVFNLRFPGQYYDAETGLHYNYFRDYEPGTGRYVESDPIGFAGGVNTYAYVENDPLDGIDFDGLLCAGCHLAPPPAPWPGSLGPRPGLPPGPTIPSDWLPNFSMMCYKLLTCTTLPGACNVKSREQQCEENLERDLASCRAMGNRDGKSAYAICERQAYLRYSNCLAGRPDGAPLPPWGTR